MTGDGPMLLKPDGAMAKMPVTRGDVPALSDIWGKAGWARFARKVVMLADGEVSDTGPILFAEWVDDGRTYRIMPDSAKAGERILLTFPAHDAGFVADRVEVRGHGAAGGRMLLYDIYWTDDGDGAVRRALEIFRGFGALPKEQSCP